MRPRAALEWTVFVVVSIVIWLSAALYLFIAGGVSRKVTGTCVRDGAVVVAILLMLPAQAATAAWLRSRHLTN
jgi:hypothetical protein